MIGERAALALDRIAPERVRNNARRPLSDWRGPPESGLLDYLRNRESRFFAGLNDRTDAVQLLRARWPDAERSTIAAADGILNGCFDLLGYTGLDFGSPPDWHLDPLRQVRAPALPHWSRIDYLDPAVAGDHKVVWELNRHQYLTTLGQAYWYTGDERYATAFVEHLTSWMDRNPPSRGVNWSSSLEVSFRVIAWLWALHFFRNSPVLTGPFVARMLRFVQAHAHHVERYLSTYFSPNTHLTGEALGLFYAGTVLPEFRHAARWRRTGLAVFATEVPRQVLSDGVYFEQSSWYHKYTVDFLTHLIILARLNGIDLPEQHDHTLERMLEHILALTRPDGTVPLIGDDDGGCLIPLVGPPGQDFRDGLATGAALFDRPDFRYVAAEASPATFWLLGRRGLEQFDGLPAVRPTSGSTAFECGGFHVMRDGWDGDARYLLVDGGPHGSLAGGHAHADALAVVVSCGADNFLVDSGTGTYTTDPAERDRFRSTPAHNTLSIDGASSSMPGGPFRWETMAATTTDRWISTDRFDFYRGSHDGFNRLGPGLVHERSILFVKRGYWIIRDRVTGAGGRMVESSFHFAPHVSVVRAGADAVMAAGSASGRALRIHVLGASAETLLESCLVSDVYGSFQPAMRVAYRTNEADDSDFVTLLLPATAADPAPALRQLDTDTGTALTLGHGRFQDRLMVGTTAGLSIDGVSTDAEWVWLRRCAETGRLLDYILIDGSALYIDGEEVIRRGGRVPHLCMENGGNS